MKSLSRWFKQRKPLAMGTPLVEFFLIAGTIQAAEESSVEKTKPKEGGEELPTEYRNWFDVSVGGIFLDGDKAQFQQRHALPGGAFGGVEEFHWEQDVGKKGLFQIDGRGIFDNHDFSLKLELSHPDIGFVRGGYTAFRTWYDGSGGFFPLNNQWFSLYDDELALDRGEAWIEGGLRLPDWPEFTVRYSHQFREGKKDSTSWGDSNLTGGVGTRGIVPSFWKIDEVIDTFEADLKHTLGNTDLGLGFRAEFSETDNSRNMRRRPGEPQDRYLTHREGVDSDLFNVHAFTETRFHEKAVFTSGYSFTTFDTDLSGSRIYGAGYEPVYDPVFARRQTRDEGFLNLSGGSQLNQYVMNLNLMITPWDHVTIVPALRVEKQDLEGSSRFLETNVGAAPALAAVEEELAASSERDLVDLAETLEVRYTGLTNWVLYARGYWMQGEGDQTEREIALTTGTLELARDTDFHRFTQKYTVGANWYPLRNVNAAAQYYHKVRNEDYDHHEDITVNTSGDRYPAFLRENDFDTDDVNFRVTWRPLNRLTLITRYDFQLSTIDMRGDGLPKGQSAETTSHIISESVTWSPLARWFMQGSINYVLDQTDTPAAQAVPGTNLVLNSKNNYWNTSFMTGYALNDKTDLQAQYLYYRADNYEDNSQFSQPYGAGAKEHSVTAGLIRRISAKIQWTLKYGFFSNHDETSGGNNNYDAHMVYSSLRYRF